MRNTIKEYWQKSTSTGGCPNSKPQPATLVHGKLVLDEWEQKCYDEWMMDLHGDETQISYQ